MGMYINRGARAFMDYANGDTLFIHLGYLTYDPEDMTVAIPNKEVGMEIVEAVRRFTDNILLVGISYDEKTKQHTCEII